jgi:hypothetical protein
MIVIAHGKSWLMIAAGVLSIFSCGNGVVAVGRSGSQEPSGMTLFTERPFSAVDEDGWGVPSSPDINNYTIDSDAAGPRSAPLVGTIRFPAGFSGGNSPAFSEKSLGNGAGTLYVSMWIKLSGNWVGHPTGTNKVLHFWIAGLNRVFAYVDGAGGNPLKPYIGLQGIATPYNDGAGQTATSVNLGPNVAGHTGVQIVRGQWYRWEIVFQANTDGGANGSADWWIDGVQVGHYTGIPYVAANQSRLFNVMRWDPTWGGQGAAVPADQFMSIDHIYVSGKP